MQFLLSSRRAFALRATTVALAASVVALLAGAVAVAAGFESRARAGEERSAVGHEASARGPTGTGAGPGHTVVDGQAGASGGAAPDVEPGPDEFAVLARLHAQRVAQARATEAEASRAAAERSRIVWPVRGGITGAFAERRGRSTHPGLDIDGETGDPVVATALGTVLWAGDAPAGFGGYGILVVVDHGEGLVTLYAHLSAVHVTPGKAVRPGELVGSMGSTGYSTGSHLHFEVRRNGVVVDPMSWLPPR